MARKLGGAPSEDSIERAAALRVQLTRDLHSKTWAIPALSALRSRRRTTPLESMAITRSTARSLASLLNNR